VRTRALTVVVHRRIRSDLACDPADESAPRGRLHRPALVDAKARLRAIASGDQPLAA
jgi:hypothetical protein